MNYNDYSGDWKDIIRPAILKRDGYKCTVCGIRHKSEVIVTKRGSYTFVDDFTRAWAISQGAKISRIYLHVCHIDQDKGNNDPSNLITMCPHHHSIFDAKHKRDRKTFFREKMKDSDKKKILEVARNEARVIRELSDMVKELTGVRIQLFECQKIIDFCNNIKNE